MVRMRRGSMPRPTVQVIPGVIRHRRRIGALGATVDISITGVGNNVGDASGEDVAVETADKFTVKVGSVGIEVGGLLVCGIAGMVHLPLVINKITITTKTSKLPALKTKPFRFVGKKRSAIKMGENAEDAGPCEVNHKDQQATRPNARDAAAQAKTTCAERKKACTPA